MSGVVRTAAWIACIVMLSACNKPTAPKPALVEDDLVGVWNGHPTYSQKWLDEVRAKNPDGDYALLVKSTRRREQLLLHTIEFRKDGTYVPPPNPLGGPAYESVKWSLSEDCSEVLVATVFADLSKDRKEPAAERTRMVRTFRIADGGQSLVALNNDGELPTTYGRMYHKSGSAADAKAFPKKQDQTEQWGCPPNLFASDYVGTWSGHHTMSKETWEGIRGVWSLENTNKEKAEFEKVATLVLRRDMTFVFRTPSAASKGKWRMEASCAVLDHDDWDAPGYQSTRPSPTKMPVDLKLQADGTLIVELRKHGSTGPIVMKRSL